MTGTIQMRAKLHAALRHLAQLIQTKDLKATRIGKDTALPRHETMKSAHVADRLMTWSQIKMVGVAKKNLNAQLFQNVLRNALDGAKRAHRHKDGCFDLAVRSSQLTQSGRAVIS